MTDGADVDRKNWRNGPPRDGEGGTSLFVRPIPQEWARSALRTCFEAFGEVIDTYIPRFPDTGNRKSFGYVEFSSEADAMAALEKMNNAPHPYEHSRTPTLTVELAKGRSGRGDRGGRGPPPRRSGGYEERRRYDDRPYGRRDDRRRDDRRYDDRSYDRRRSPPRGRSRSRSPPRGYRERSRSPPRGRGGRSRSPPRSRSPRRD